MSAHSVFRNLVLGATMLTLPACNGFTRLSEVGNGPQLSKIEDPQANPEYKPVNLPMPQPMVAERNPNSLWRGGARAFFKDQRAQRVGDLMTVIVSVQDQAVFKNTSNRTRDNSENVGLPNILGFETSPSGGESALQRFLTGVDPSKLLSMAATTNNTGSGSIVRNEAVNLRVAAMITQVLPNGNLVIQGRQEMRVNTELRELTITGVIRPEDILSNNSISYEKIAEARISYSGRGIISDVQQPRWGQQLFDIVAPF
ncbi:Flagellar L-ring protein [Azospirillaceae bacterium]